MGVRCAFVVLAKEVPGHRSGGEGVVYILRSGEIEAGFALWGVKVSSMLQHGNPVA